MKTFLQFFKNKSFSLTFALFVFSIISNQVYSQLPQYYNFNTIGSANSFPFNQPAGKETQWLYHPGEFNQPTAMPAGSITSIALRINETYPLGTTTYTNFTIKLGQSTVTSFTTSSFYSGPMKTVLYKTSVTYSCAGGQWLNIPLDSAFNYNPSLSLIVEISQCGAPLATGFSMCQTSFPEMRRNYSIAGCPFAYGGTANNIAHIGFNMCAAVSPSNTTVSMNQSICSGNSTTLTALGSGSLSWFNSPTGGSYLGAGSALGTPTLSSNTTYYVQDSSVCGVSPRTPITVTVNALPSVTVTGLPSTTICAGQSVTLTASGASTYTWSSGPTNASIIVSPTVTTSYTATGTSGATGCKGVKIITVNVAACTGVVEALSNANNLNFYPNPNNGNFILAIDSKSEIIIINLVGQEIARLELEAGENQINLGGIVNGIYFIKVSNKSYTKTLKMIKE